MKKVVTKIDAKCDSFHILATENWYLICVRNIEDHIAPQHTVKNLTKAVWDVIFVPPDAPETIATFPFSEFTTIVGQVDDIGLLPGRIKLCGLGGTPKELVTLGELRDHS